MFLVHVLLTAAASVSAVVYALYLWMVIRYRKQEPFSSSFFQLTIPLGFADLWALLHTYVLIKFPIWGYFHSFYTANNGKPWLAQYSAWTTAYTTFVQLFGILLLATNRWTAIKYPAQHKLQWKNRYKLAIALQFLLPLLFVTVALLVPTKARYAYVVCLDLPHQCDNGSDLQTRTKDGVPTADESNTYLFSQTVANETRTIILNINKVALDFQPTPGSEASVERYKTANGLLYLLIIAAIIAANVATIFGLVKHRKAVAPASQHQSNADLKRAQTKLKAERRLTIASMTVCAVLMVFLLCSIAMSSAAIRHLDSYLIWVVVDCFQYINPYIILACSPTARGRLLQMLLLKQ